MKILIDDGMQVEIGTGIGKYTYNLKIELEKIISKYSLGYVELYKFKIKKKDIRFLKELYI